MKVFGITGWKNSGKTGLMERLVSEIIQRGFSVSTVKHAHHSFDVDHAGRDSYRHRDAGAKEVLLSSGTRWALMHELRSAPEFPLSDLLAKLSPVDLVLVEGFKSEGHRKLECHRKGTGKSVLATDDPLIVAVASDHPLEIKQPVIDLNDTQTIADFVLKETGLQ